MELRASWLSEFLKHSVLIAGAIVVLLPFYLMLSYSLKSPSEIETNTGGFTGAQQIMTDSRCVKAGNAEEDCLMRPIVYNYTAAFKEAPLVRYMLNGVFVTVSIFIIQVIVCLLYTSDAADEMRGCLVGSEMCIRDRLYSGV